MANTYASTVLLEGRLWQSDMFAKEFELRKNLTEIFGIFLDGQNAVPRLDEIKKATTQATSIMYPTKKDFTIITEKSCSPDGQTGGTGKVSLTWAQKGFAIKHQTKKYDGNELSSAKGLANDLYEAEASFWFGASGMDATLLAWLDTNRTQVNAISDGTGHNTWAGNPNYYVDVAAVDRNRFYNWLSAEMMKNNYSGMMYDLHDTLWGADVAYYASQGTANSVNTAFQFDNIMRKRSNLITPAGYFNSYHYVIPKNGVALLTWNEPMNRANKVVGERERTTIESAFFPGVYFDVFIKSSCADTTVDGGAPQDEVIDYEFILNYSIIKQPLTTAGETPIFKYQVRSA